MFNKYIDFFMITICSLGIAVVTHFFQVPNHFIFGGVTSLAILLSSVTPLSFAAYNIAINLILILAGFLCLGKSFGLRTIYVTLLTSVCYEVLEFAAPISAPLTSQPMLEALVVVVGISALSAELFQKGACSGGTDIAAMILRKYIRMDIGRALLVIDFTSAACSFLLYDITTGLFSVTGLLARTFVVDNVLESINLCKYFAIVCADPEPISRYIREDLKRGATLCPAKGLYSGENRTLILTAVKRGQAIKLRNYIHMAAPDAFLVITNSSEIIGRGFLLE